MFKRNNKSDKIIQGPDIGKHDQKREQISNQENKKNQTAKEAEPLLKKIR